MKNNDEDIKEKIILLKDFIKGHFEIDKIEHCIGSYKMGYFYYSDIKEAINVALSELENLKWKNEIYVKSIKSHKSAIEKQEKELETYKKIAEFMADFINMYTLSGEENQYCHRVIDCQVIGGSRSCIECIIDWARKEVENESNN